VIFIYLFLIEKFCFGKARAKENARNLKEQQLRQDMQQKALMRVQREAAIRVIQRFSACDLGFQTRSSQNNFSFPHRRTGKRPF
jgi:hypothetical protein